MISEYPSIQFHDSPKHVEYVQGTFPSEQTHPYLDHTRIIAASLSSPVYGEVIAKCMSASIFGTRKFPAVPAASQEVE